MQNLPPFLFTRGLAVGLVGLGISSCQKDAAAPAVSTPDTVKLSS